MKLLRRFIYLLYYLKELNFNRIRTFNSYASENTGRSRFAIGLDAFFCVLKYNVSLIDYYYFRFFELSDSERSLWAGTGYMYEYQLKMNPRGVRQVLEDKIQFLKAYNAFFKRAYFSLDDMANNPLLAENMLANSSGRMVLKNSHGQVGSEVEVIYCEHFTPKKLMKYMKKKNYNLAEEFVVQHPMLMELSPSGLNTLRIFTQLHEGNVRILGARLRVSVNSTVDNMGAGNLAAPVDIETGKVYGPGVYSDITKADEEIHPVTKRPIKGFNIPFWGKVISLTESVALYRPDNKSVGWDIAVTGEGPELIEGNHNWCKLLWQLPVKQGLKAELEKYQ